MLSQVRQCYDMLGQVMPRHIRLGQFRSVQAWLGHVWPDWARLFQVRPNYVTLC
jgi:hypothetical protein